MKIKRTSIFHYLLLRQQPVQPLALVIKGGIGGLLAIGTMAQPRNW